MISLVTTGNPLSNRLSSNNTRPKEVFSALAATATQGRCSTEGSLVEFAMATTILRIEIPGWPVNDYRITEGKQLEFRALDSNGRPLPDQWGTWRRLTASELILHFRFNTVVAHWFLEKTAEWDSDSAPQEVQRVA